MLLKQLNLLGLVTLLLFCTCKKKSGTIPIDSAVKEFYSFAPGTYWIYYDSLTGQTDSFLVSQDDTRVTSSSHEAIETIVIMIYKNGVPDSVYISWNLIEYGVGFEFMPYHPGSIGRCGCGFNYPYSRPGTLNAINIFNSYDLNGNNYQTVLETKGADYTNTNNDTFFISTNAGLIGIYTHSVLPFRLSLIRYKIIH